MYKFHVLELKNGIKLATRASCTPFVQVLTWWSQKHSHLNAHYNGGLSFGPNFSGSLRTFCSLSYNCQSINMWQDLGCLKCRHIFLCGIICTPLNYVQNKKFVYFLLRMKDIADLIPQANPDGSGHILKPEFKNILRRMGFYLSDTEFERLWQKWVFMYIIL